MKTQIIAGLAAAATMLVSAAGAAHAQAPDPTDCYKSINDGPDCRVSRLEDDNKALNAAYAVAIQIMKARDSGQGAQVFEEGLRQAQRDWVAFRESQCQLESLHYYQGSGRSVLYFGCMSDLTKSRTEFLKRIPDLFD